MFITYALTLFVNFLNLIWSIFMPFDIISQFANFMTIALTYLPKLMEFLGYVAYFIPMQFLTPILILCVSFAVFRIIFAIVHLFKI